MTMQLNSSSFEIYLRICLTEQWSFETLRTVSTFWDIYRQMRDSQMRVVAALRFPGRWALGGTFVDPARELCVWLSRYYCDRLTWCDPGKACPVLLSKTQAAGRSTEFYDKWPRLRHVRSIFSYCFRWQCSHPVELGKELGRVAFYCAHNSKSLQALYLKSWFTL